MFESLNGIFVFLQIYFTYLLYYITLLYFLEKQSNENMDYKYGYHPSQIAPYSLADSKRFLKIIFPAIRTVFQFIVIIFWYIV